MPIVGLTDRVQFPRIGKIHISLKDESDLSGNDKYFGKQVDWFVVKEDQSTSKEAVEAFKSVYGDKPNCLDIILPYNDINLVFPQYFKRYGKTGLKCYGDGINATYLTEEGTWEQYEDMCAFKGCEHFESGECKRVANFKFLLPYVKGAGVWQLDTSSINSIRNINGGIMQIIAYSQIVNKSVLQIPAKLTVRMQEIPYKRRNEETGEVKQYIGKHPILNILISQSLAEIIKESKPKLPIPTKEDKEIPEDLVPISEPEQENSKPADEPFGEKVEKEKVEEISAEETKKYNTIKKLILDATSTSQLKAILKSFSISDLPKDYRVELANLYDEQYKKVIR